MPRSILRVFRKAISDILRPTFSYFSENMTFLIPDLPKKIFSIYRGKLFCVHGDLDPQEIRILPRQIYFCIILVLTNLQNRFESQLLVHFRVDTFSENVTFILCSTTFFRKCDLYFVQHIFPENATFILLFV